VTAVEAQASGLPCLLSDVITTECRIGDRTVFLPISMGVATWAEILLTMDLRGCRDDGVDAARQAGFDVMDTAARIERAYKEKFR